MTATRPLLRDSALLLPLFVVAGAVYGGAWGALGVLVAGVVSIGNLALLGLLIGKVVAAAANEGGSAVAALGLPLKGLLVLVVYGGLMKVFDPGAIALGVGTVVLGVCIRGLLSVLQPSTGGYPDGPDAGPRRAVPGAGET